MRPQKISSPCQQRLPRLLIGREHGLFGGQCRAGLSGLAWLRAARNLGRPTRLLSALSRSLTQTGCCTKAEREGNLGASRTRHSPPLLPPLAIAATNPAMPDQPALESLGWIEHLSFCYRRRDLTALRNTAPVLAGRPAERQSTGKQARERGTSIVNPSLIESSNHQMVWNGI